LSSKITRNHLSAGLCPAHWGSIQCSPDPVAGLRDLLLKGEERRGESGERAGKGEKREGKEGKRQDGMGSEYVPLLNKNPIFGPATIYCVHDVGSDGYFLCIFSAKCNMLLCSQMPNKTDTE